jgi:hypothetical protein
MRVKLARIFFRWSASLSLHGIKLHFVSKCPFTRQSILPLYVAVNHDDRRRVIIKAADDDRHRVPASYFTGSFPAMSGNKLVSTFFTWAHDCWNQNTMLRNTLGSVFHRLIVKDSEWMIREREELRKWHVNNSFLRHLNPSFFGLEDVIVWE